ncbi:MAG: hypothetical protein JSR39_09050 [Verrucomicrobia bacterium]|nr:hypothetical protein [Verrucomicrobiota bacterium]
MAIYDIFEYDRNEMEKGQFSPEFLNEEATEGEEPQAAIHQTQLGRRDRFFSSLTARLFFLLLLTADILWFFYAAVLFVVTGMLKLATLSKVPFLNAFNARMWLTIKRSLVCGLSLFITLFSPAFGIMIACTYFLMYDKSGIEEVVPSSLQSQFKEFFKG